MHIYFSGIGGTAMGPLALIAKQAGYEVSGSDKQTSQYTDYLKAHGIENIHIGQTAEEISKIHQAKPIDWLVYSSAVPMEDPNHPELVFAKDRGIKTSKRDELTSKIIADKGLKLVAIAGTHGKTTTTAMAVWLFKQLKVPVSHSVGAKISFGDMGAYDPKSQYFVLEADEFDLNFLSFHPYMSLITGIDWDHPDIYPSREDYYQVFRQFIDQSEYAAFWQSDVKRLDHKPTDHQMVLDDDDPKINQLIKLTGQVNRQNAWLTANSLLSILNEPAEKLAKLLNDFPGLSRRFEEIVPGLYSDYAHTPGKIRGALQMAHEVAADKVVVVYEGLHNLRQHFIKDELKNLFDDVKHLYIVPSYLAREDQTLELLTPTKILNLLSNKSRQQAETAQLDDKLKQVIQKHLNDKNLVLCLSAGGGGSLDEWLRREFKK
ncbi:hypothetical protein A3F65_03030 [Candidatus Saccharibacteria bacterium RIFCSPHIGHO2_12_FULL_47_16b]|nr:MAG: hypothetical protein A3F65_03030 [Candidatus Saccharibacteria bacterium RIFCSPHIGHO2_12_FULL_47_16b]